MNIPVCDSNEELLAWPGIKKTVYMSAMHSVLSQAGAPQNCRWLQSSSQYFDMILFPEHGDLGAKCEHSRVHGMGLPPNGHARQTLQGRDICHT